MASIKTDDNNFKRVALGHQPMVFSPEPMPDLKHLAVFVMTKVIPEIEKRGEVGFMWNGNDVNAYDTKNQTKIRDTFAKQKWKCDDGEGEMWYEFKKNGKTITCWMKSEIWYDPKQDMPLSPFAVLMRQLFANGIFLVNCRFETA